MKKVKPIPQDELRTEYKRSDFPRALIRGKCLPKARKKPNIKDSLASFRRAGAVEAEQGTDHLSSKAIDAEIKSVRRKRGQ
jgi:hypothetical protein